MRYILDSEGYVYDVSLGADIMCDLGDCVEYTGKIPSGYSTLDEWLIEETPRLNAWKIVEGDLAFDEDRAIELERIFNEQAELNRHVTYGEVQGMLKGLDIETSNQEELGGILPIRSESGKVITLFDSSSYPMERISIKCAETIEVLKLYITTSNMLPNNAMSGYKDGITYVVNEDKSITLLGNSAEGFSLNVSGNETNTEPLFIFKANETYYINNVASNVNLNLYSHDGTDRVLFYTGVGGTSITPEEDTPITHAELTCTGEVDTTVYLMVSAGATKPYEECIRNIVPIDLNQRVAQLDSVIEIEGEVIVINGDAVNVMEMPCTYFENTTIYTDKNTTLDIDYKKSGFDYITRRGTGTLTLRNTADGYGSIRLITIENLEAGSVYTLEAASSDEAYEHYTIDLTGYTGTVDIEIEEGVVYVTQDGEDIGILDNIHVKTYSPTTYISILEGSYRLLCEYMIASDFSIYCTRVEKDASIKLLDDKISLEVSRASAVEGELSGRIDVEADRVEQIVESVGADGKVTAASIVTAINEGESEVLISADKVNMSGVIFPTIQNASGECQITTLFNSALGDGIEYNSKTMHVFNGSIVINPSLPLYGLQVNDTTSTELLRVRNGMVVVGNTGVEVNLFGTVKINGEDISTLLTDIETILNTLNSGGGV